MYRRRRHIGLEVGEDERKGFIGRLGSSLIPGIGTVELYRSMSKCGTMEKSVLSGRVLSLVFPVLSEAYRVFSVYDAVSRFFGAKGMPIWIDVAGFLAAGALQYACRETHDSLVEMEALVEMGVLGVRAAGTSRKF
jgi:hypothetical protein